MAIEQQTLANSPEITMLLEQLALLPEPEVDARNKKHFVLPDGTVVLKCAPWLDAQTGEAIGEVPLWVRICQTNVDVEKADYIVNLPDLGHGQGGCIALRNPLTGEVVEKVVPWLQKGELILDEYVPGITVSPGRKIIYAHNPNREFDDPSDPDNLNYFSRAAIDRAENFVFTKLQFERDRGRPGGPMLTAREADTPVVDKGIVGISIGGTVLMEKTDAGLVPIGGLDTIYENHFKDAFPSTILRSYAFQNTRSAQDAPRARGIDSSQTEIDFLGDTVISMVSLWNRLSPEERKQFAGFLIAIGTDTAVEATTLLQMMLGPDCPFSAICVGAMKPSGEENSDGLPNIRKALEHLHALHELSLATVALRVEGGLFNPTRTHKASAGVAAAFIGQKLLDTEAFEEVGHVKERFHKVKEEDYNTEYKGAVVMRGVDEVEFITSNISKDPMRVRSQVRSSPAKAILVEAYPSFTAATNIQRAILDGANGRPVFYINQIPGGAVDDNYEVTRRLVSSGVYPLQMTEHAARAKLNYAIRLFGEDQQKIVDFMTKNNFVGEQPQDFSVYSRKVMNETAFLRSKLYDSLGITEALRISFSSPEFRRSRATALLQKQIRAGIGEQLTTDLSANGSAGDVGVIDREELYEAYLAIEALELEDLIQMIKANQGGLQDRLRSLDQQLLENVLNGSVSTVSANGMPIQLEIAA